MKRTLEPDMDTQLAELPARIHTLPEHSRTLLAQVNLKYVRAMKLANRFMQHVEDLYQNEAFCSDHCYMHLEAPELTFDWINVGIDRDVFVLLGSTSGLVTFFNYIGQDEKEERAKIWHLTEAHRAHCHELLVEYFVKHPRCELVIENGGEDGQFKGGRIGPSTQWMWEATADKDEEDESSSDHEESEASDDEATVQRRIDDAVANPMMTLEYF